MKHPRVGAGRRPPPVPRMTAADLAALQGSSETEFHLSVAEYLRRALPPPTWFFHVPNQGRRSIAGHQVTVAMGMLPGMTDIVLVRNPLPFLDPTGGCPYGFLELKRPDGKGRLSKPQEDFREFCEARAIPWGEAKSLAEVETFVRLWLIRLGLEPRAALS